MGSVYRNGLCNLAATAAVDADRGLFHERQFSILQDCRIKSSWDDKTNLDWRVRPTYFPKSELLDGPLLSRGWVIQERIMSRRILHFGRRQLFWECHGLNACETYADGIPNFLFPTMEGAFAMKPEYQALDRTSETPLRRRQFWYRILSAYTSCHLTREEDKLVAISGVAKSFQASFGGWEYVAGLWREHLISDMCWSIPNGLGRRPKLYRAPSWSWASIDGEIQFHHCSNGHGNVAKILGVSVQPLTYDSTGEIKEASLQIQAPLMTIFLYSKNVNRATWVYKVQINGIWCTEVGETGLGQLGEAGLDAGYHGSLQGLHCMPLQWSNSSHTMAPCLILQPTGHREGQFKRLGILEVNFELYKIAKLDAIMNRDWFEFEKSAGDGQYIITVV